MCTCGLTSLGYILRRGIAVFNCKGHLQFLGQMTLFSFSVSSHPQYMSVHFLGFWFGAHLKGTSPPFCDYVDTGVCRSPPVNLGKCFCVQSPGSGHTDPQQGASSLSGEPAGRGLLSRTSCSARAEPGLLCPRSTQEALKSFCLWECYRGGDIELPKAE